MMDPVFLYRAWGREERNLQKSHGMQDGLELVFVMQDGLVWLVINEFVPWEMIHWMSCLDLMRIRILACLDMAIK